MNRFQSQECIVSILIIADLILLLWFTATSSPYNKYFAGAHGTAVLSLTSIFFRNTNLRLAKDLASQVNIYMILVFLVVNLVVDIICPRNNIHWIFGSLFMVAVVLNMFLDTTIHISRSFRLFVCSIGIFFIIILLLTHFSGSSACTNSDLISRTFNSRINRVLVQRTTLEQMLVLHVQAIWVMFVDKKQVYLPFSLGPVSKRSTPLVHIVPKQQRNRSLVHQSVMLSLPASRPSTSSTTTATTISTLTTATESHHQPQPQHQQPPSPPPQHANTNPQPNLQEWILIIFRIAAVVCFLLQDFPVKQNQTIIQIIEIVFAGLCLGLAFPWVIYKNIDFQVLRRALKQFHVFTILSCLLANLILDIVFSSSEVSVPQSLLFAFFVIFNMLLDTLKVVSRQLKIVSFVGTISVVLINLFDYYVKSKPCGQDELTTFLGSEINRTLSKRSIMFTLLVFHVRAWVTLANDHNDVYLLFVTARVRKGTNHVSASSQFFTPNTAQPPRARDSVRSRKVATQSEVSIVPITTSSTPAVAAGATVASPAISSHQVSAVFLALDSCYALSSFSSIREHSNSNNNNNSSSNNNNNSSSNNNNKSADANSFNSKLSAHTSTSVCSEIGVGDCLEQHMDSGTIVDSTTECDAVSILTTLGEDVHDD